MKAPLSWLKEFVDIECSPEELKDKLFSCGFEVEEMVYVGENIDKIVTCQIVSIDKHPNADKLSVTQVNAGKYGNLQIITAAKNISVGDVVPVALDGSTLANGEHIYNGELRGLPSYGMFCSGEELGITDDWYQGASVNGILILSKEMPLGEEVKKLLEIEDVMFDINVTANRSDCQSILGIAREVAAVLNKPLKMPALDYEVSNNFSTKNLVEVKNLALDLCPRYMAHLVKDIKIEQSPLWLKRRLFSVGIRSINNIVDITNYVLTEIGQPMHAFDISKLEGSSIIVRRAENEKITTLDEKIFDLTSDNLAICDKVKPVAIAGIMGGLNSGINNETKDVLFESATFARDNIRKSSRALGQRSDSSSRFEKGVDLYSVEIGLKRALNLISQLKYGTICADEYDLHQVEIKEKSINTTIPKINGVLGIEVPSQKIKEILERLSFKVEINGDNISVLVPLFREDMEDYPDIAEEVIREYGYDKIKPTLLKTSSITNGGLNSEQNKEASLKDLLVGYGFNEIITYSFVSEKEYDIFNLDKNSDEHRFIKLINPIGEDLAVMRTSLLPSIIRTIGYNLNRKNLSGRLFELAKVYNAKSLPLKELAIESRRLSFAMYGEEEDFFTAKGVVEGIVNSFAFNSNIEYKKCQLPFMHPTRSADIIINGVAVGYFGQLHPVLSEKLDLTMPVYCGEIYYDKLKELFNDKIVFEPISKFPIVERDLALIVDKQTTCGEVISCIKNAGGSFLKKVKLFDIYQGEQIGADKKSLAYNLVFSSLERTLVVEEIDQIIQNILKALRDNLNAQLR